MVMNGDLELPSCAKMVEVAKEDKVNAALCATWLFVM